MIVSFPYTECNLIFTLVNELLRSTHKYSSGGGVYASDINGDATKRIEATDNNVRQEF